jgi:hypothetical protein
LAAPSDERFGVESQVNQSSLEALKNLPSQAKFPACPAHPAGSIRMNRESSDAHAYLHHNATENRTISIPSVEKPRPLRIW